MDLDTQPLMTRMLNNECVERKKTRFRDFINEAYKSLD